MVNAAAQYRRALKKKLRCNIKAKKRLLDGFNRVLTAYLEEHSNPTIDDLTIAFGPPKAMAEVLMAELTPKEHTQYRKTVLLQKILLAALAVLLLVLTVYIWFYKTNGLTTVDEGNYIGITEESTQSNEE